MLRLTKLEIKLLGVLIHEENEHLKWKDEQEVKGFTDDCPTCVFWVLYGYIWEYRKARARLLEWDYIEKCKDRSIHAYRITDNGRDAFTENTGMRVLKP